MWSLLNLRIQRRLSAGFGVVLVFTAAIGGWSMWQLRAVDIGTQGIVSDKWPKASLANDVVNLAKDNGLASLNLFFLVDDAAIEQSIATIAANQKEIDRLLDTLGARAHGVDERDLVAEVGRARDTYASAFAGVVAKLHQENDPFAARAVFQRDAVPAMGAFTDRMQALIRYERGQLELAGRLASDEYRVGLRAVLILSLGALLVGALFAYRITTSITVPIRRVCHMMREIRSGHLSHRLAIDSRDEVGDLARAMDEFAAALQGRTLALIDRLSRGDLDVQIEAVDSEDEVAPVLRRIVASLRALVQETRTLAAAGREGRLMERANAGQLEGAYRDIVEGINAALDAVVLPIDEASRILDRVAKRDLTVRMSGEYRGDYDRIKQSLNQALDNLEVALSETLLTAEQVGQAADQVTAESEHLAQGSSEQAASLHQVSSSLDRMASMATQSANQAREAQTVSTRTGDITERGVQEMRRLSDAIEEIKRSTDSTARIVRTIDEIAFQTNLLALNAAVEAARAGESGRGFAVVADEVRALALRSAEAAKNTAELIETSVRTADEGVAINRDVLARLSEITDGVSRMRGAMEQIVASGEAQRADVDQISAAMQSANHVTQATAASAQESASMALELAGQTRRLRDLVGGFALPDAPAVVQPPAVVHRSPPLGRAPRHPLSGVGVGR
jgi:methyl-accepting chemotaxis protein